MILLKYDDVKDDLLSKINEVRERRIKDNDFLDEIEDTLKI
jgi:hypothetical protein